MADNYLERRMEDYREGRDRASAQARHATLSAAAKSRPTLFILGGESPEGSRLIDYFRKLDWRVAFTHSIPDEGRRIAQLSGAQFHPIDPADLTAFERSQRLIEKRWGHLDLILNFTASPAAKIPGSDTPILKIE